MGRLPYVPARTGPDGLLNNLPPHDVLAHWTADAVDGSNIDVDRHLLLRCFPINLDG